VYAIGKDGVSVFKPAVSARGKSIVFGPPGTALRARHYAACRLLFYELLPFLLHREPLHLLHDGNWLLSFFHDVL